ncbi:GRAM domain-containing protein 2B-like [Cheilinus undulatus]|uniref:GRAM domain-containing protein 2B-like n=1 Tax=Cheilinus undulatus TaxID=241271 RepID=UPI001BD236CA|nr:GRAM domain-containing protein 2B-like [Cheilinus undulatus]
MYQFQSDIYFPLSRDRSVEGAGLLGAKGGDSRYNGKKPRQSQSLDDARLEMHELNHSLNASISLREQTIAEENVERPEGLINNKSFKKHNKSFHKLFPGIPEAENLTHAFICAMQKEVLYHGKLYISEHHVCFHSSVLLRDTKVAVSGCSVSEVRKYNSALSMLSIKTSDGEKYTFVSLRNRELCYKLLHNICSYAKGSANSSPHLSSAENEAEPEVASGYSSLEDSIDHDLSRQNSLNLENSFPQMSSEGPTRSNSTRNSSLTDTINRGPWMWRIIERVVPFLFVREMRNINILFFIYVILMALLLVASGYLRMRIIALEEQLNSLGALTEMALHHRQYKET